MKKVPLITPLVKARWSCSIIARRHPLSDDAAPSQPAEATFRDPYLSKFISDATQTFALLNYDLSYVNTLTAPAAMEASDVPIITGSDIPPSSDLKYYLPNEAFGWHGSDKSTQTFNTSIKDFVNNTGSASIGMYFDGKGWPQYYNPDGDFIIPSGANVFDNSSLDYHVGAAPAHTSTYDANHFLLTSSNTAPIQAGGSDGDQGFVHDDATDRIYLNNPPATFFSDLKEMLKAGTVNAAFPGSPDVLATVKSFNAKPDKGMPYVTLNSAITPSGPSGKVYQFTRTATDYATTAITNLWYSWAKFYVDQFTNAPPAPTEGTLVKSGGNVTNQITLTSLPSTQLAVGMSVTANQGILPGTTILKIEGDTIYLSTVPTSDPGAQLYTFGNPVDLLTDPTSKLYTKPYGLTFDPAATPNAKLFAGSVYEAMSAEALRLQLTPAGRSPTLPLSMDVVANVIEFNANLPTFDTPWGHTLVGEVRDVVKSIFRGVYDFNKVPDQSKWYPAPDDKTGGQQFNVFNLDPYVWFVHKVEKLSGYGFSVDDDVSNPEATGPTQNDNTNHNPNNLQIGFGGTKGTGDLKKATPLGNQNEWFPTTRFGKFQTTATIGVWQGAPDDPYNGYSVITLTDSNPVRTLNKIVTPGPGQIGAYISASGYIVPGTTLIFFPTE